MSHSKLSDNSIPTSDAPAIVLRKQIICNRFRRLTSLSTLVDICVLFFKQMTLVHPQNITYTLELLQGFSLDELFNQMELLIVNPCRSTEISDLEVFDHELEQNCDLFIERTAVLQHYLAQARGKLFCGNL